MNDEWKRSRLLALGMLSCVLALQCSSEVPEGTPAGGENVEGAVLAVAPDPDPDPLQQPSARRTPRHSEPSDATAQSMAVELPPGGVRLAEDSFTTQDLGQAREGESLETAFELVSGGEGPLVIESIQPSCGCTVPGIYLHGERGEPTLYELGDPIPAGTRVRLLVKVYTQGKNGKFGSDIKLVTNDPVGLFSVRVEADVEPALEFTPDRRIDVGQLGEREQEVRVVRVKSYRQEPFLLRKDYLPEGIGLELSPVDPDVQGRASAWDATVTVGPGLPVGDVNYSLQLFSDIEIQDPRNPNSDGSPQYHPAVLVVQKLGLLHAQPAFLSLGAIEPGGIVERRAKIASRDGFPFDPRADMPIEVLGTDGRRFEFSDYVSTTLVPSEDGESVEVRLRLECPPLEVDRSFLGSVNIRVGHPRQDIVSVRFSVTFRGSPAAAGEDGN